MKRRTLQLLLMAFLSTAGAIGQIDCANSNKLVCQIPFSTGVYSKNGATSAQQATQLIATAFNSAIATQVSQLPLASASSGVVVIYKAGVPESYNNLGPILTDRAQTVGKHKLFLGFTTSQFYFTDINGISLSHVPFAYPATASDGTVIYTEESTNIHFKVNQYVAVATYGLMDKLDISVVVPVERVSIGAATFNAQEYLVAGGVTQGPYKVPSTFSPGAASGVGDLTFLAKRVIWNGEHSTLAAGISVRTPTGDDRNYLGSGAWGFNPYAVFSYLAKIAPHAKIGYQWNTATELNNPTQTAGGNQSLPGGLQYDIGADWAWTKSLTFAGDLLGSQYLNSTKLASTNIVLPNGTNLPTVAAQNGSYTISDLSTGLKWRPYRDLTLSGNVLFQLNNVGLRTRPAPLVGISYRF